MIPTIEVRDTVLVDDLSFRIGSPRFGDVAVFEPPFAPSQPPYVKRVVGVPGDRIVITNGLLYRNGVAVREPYLNESTNYDLRVASDTIFVNGNPLKREVANIPPRIMWKNPDRIPAGFYLVLGDNRNYSDDSHVWGFAKLNAFIGRVVAVVWPPGRIGVLH